MNGNVIKTALKDVKVVDFSWLIAGPYITKYLHDFGATVVRIETKSRPDPLRMASPMKDKITGVDRSGLFAYANANKYSMSLNLGQPKGIDVAKKLVAWADVVAENFTPGTMEKFGLGYQELKKIKPDIIMMSSSIQGQTGPRAETPGHGLALVGLAGLTNLTGWPDRVPAQPFGGYADLVSPPFGAAALLAALAYKRRTGKGQYMDLSQFEANVHFLAPLFLDYVSNGREASRAGNECPYAAPHAAYRCRGDDRWCVISVFTDDEWQAFCKAIGGPEWTKHPEFCSLLNRKKNEAELDKLVEEWTVRFSAEEVTELMQSAGVAAMVVKTARDVLDDPQLIHRQFFWSLNHREIGPLSHLGQACILSKTPAQGRTPGPCLGEHTEMVCREILGMPDEEFVELLNAGVFE